MFAKLVRSKVSNVVVSLSLVSVALLAGYAHEAVAATPTVRNETVTALVSGWGNGIIDPSRGGAENAQYSRLLHAMLVEGDGRGGLTGGVARSWDMSPDGRTWTFTIRDGVKAHNGEAITADDVRFSLDVRYGDLGRARVAAGGKLTAPTLALQAITKSVEKIASDSLFYVNLPWGLGPRIKDYKPWSLTTYMTAIWTLELN